MLLAGELCKPAYPLTEAAMLTTDLSIPGAAISISTVSDDLSLGINGAQLDRSFTRQMEQLYSGELGNGDLPAYFFTAFSAIPIAAAVQSYHMHTGYAQQPQSMSYIRANKKRGDAYWQREAELSEDDRAEIARLEPLVKDTDVCIVEQLVESGSTIGYGARLLLEAGAQKVLAVRGYWYLNARLAGINLDRLTSRHGTFMRRIGKLAAEPATLAHHG